MNSEYLNIADNANLSTGNIDFTVAAWVYPDSLTDDRSITAKFTPGGNQREYLLRLNATSGAAAFFVSSDGVNVDGSVTGSNRSTGVWSLIIAWHDSVGDTINIQENNGSVTSTAFSAGVFDSTAEFRLGTRGDLIQFWDGRIDEVGCWKKVLTSQERTNLYNGGSGNTYDSAGTCVPQAAMFSVFE